MSIKERFYTNLNMLREDYDRNAADDAKELKDLGSGKVSRKSDKKIQKMFRRDAADAFKKAVTGMEPGRKGKKALGEEQLNELRGKGTLDKKDKEELQGRIRKKHGEAWTETERIRKEKKSKGSEDTKKIDKYRNRLAKIHNKLDEEQLDELRGYRKKKLFGKDPLVAVANRAINRMKLPPNDGKKLSPEELASNKKYRKVSQMAFDRMPD